uniref:Capsid protein n=5 Tax=Norwalk-like virus TaxID=95340 RepID=Q6WQW7_NORV|nr:capsid protein [Norwalk-like virus]
MKMTDKDLQETAPALGQVLPPEVEVVIPVEPTAGAQIAAPTAGQVNPIDPWIFANFVQAPQGEFTISPNNNPGEVLFELELGPDLNPYLAHLHQMYNGWTGSIRVKVILAGNAFSAGKIIVFCIPPGFDVSYLTPSQATQFPHVIMDVRAAEPIEIPLADVRNVLFHQGPDSRMRLMGMLYTPLRANSGADPFVVTGRVLTCPSPDFSFFFLIPPTVEERSTPFSVPNVPIYSLTNSRAPVPIFELRSSRSLPLTVQFQNGRCTVEGDLLGTTPLSAGDLCSFMCIRGDTQHIAELLEPDESAFVVGERPATLGFPDFSQCVLNLLLADGTGVWHQTLDVKNQQHFTPGIGQVTLSGDVPRVRSRARLDYVSSTSQESFWVLPDYRTDVLGSEFAPAVSAPGVGETILFFMGKAPVQGPSNPLPCLLPLEWVFHFASERPTKQSDVALLNYINPDTGRVLFEAKLYSSGFLTVNLGTANEAVLPINGIFKFASWVSLYYQLRPVGTLSAGRRLPRIDGY